MRLLVTLAKTTTRMNSNVDYALVGMPAPSCLLVAEPFFPSHPLVFDFLVT
jgi:hypothetical protein